jgi:hypothetical protein
VGRVQSSLSFTRFAVQSFGRAEKKSWYTGFHKKQLRVAPLRRSASRRRDWWRRALSWYRNLSLGQEQSAKTMTSLLIIPSVLGFRSIIILAMAESFLYFFFLFFWIRYQ